jgi:glycosyltransferase involved in cell wall biosynthesis
LKILVINTFDSYGGAAKAASRLCEGLISAGHEARMLVMEKGSNHDYVFQPGNIFYRRFGRIRGYLDLLPAYPKTGRRVLFSSGRLSSRSVMNEIEKFDPDILHLHWINKGFLDLSMLTGLKIPVIWTFHDMWAFTGGCHIAHDCSKYQYICETCPILKSKRKKDLSYRNFRRKQKIYSGLPHLEVITPSNWLANCVKSSSLMKSFGVNVIPNSLNISTFYPEDRISCRNRLGLDPSSRIILFGAINALKDLNKGYARLIQALKNLNNKENVQLIVFGTPEEKEFSLAGMKVKYLGYISDHNLLRQLYSSSDIVVVPSSIEVFGQTATEAMACGTPVAAFNTSGLMDIVDHKINGFLAENGSLEDLTKGIEWCLYEADPIKLSLSARQKVLKEFSEDIIIQKHIDLYKETLENGKD